MTNREIRENRERSLRARSFCMNGGVTVTATVAMVVSSCSCETLYPSVEPSRDSGSLVQYFHCSLCDVLLDNEPRNARKGFRARNFCMNGGITVFETRFPRDSQKQESTAVPRTRWRSDIRNFSPSPPVFASCGPSCSKKVSNTVTATVPLRRTLLRLRSSCSTFC